MGTVSAVDFAKGHIQDLIVKGVLLPGQKIKEEGISKQLDISRPPIREAFKILEGEGLITRRPNKGVFVSKINEKDIWEIYSLKKALHELAVALALEVISEKQIAQLEALIAKMESCLRSGEEKVISKYQDLNSRFHNVFFKASNHKRLNNILSNLETQIKRVSYQAFADKGFMRLSCEHHRKILEAIRKGNKKKAIALAGEHVQVTAEIHLKLARQAKNIS